MEENYELKTLRNRILTINLSWKKESFYTIWINNSYLNMILFSKACSWI